MFLKTHGWVTPSGGNKDGQPTSFHFSALFTLLHSFKLEAVQLGGGMRWLPLSLRFCEAHSAAHTARPLAPPQGRQFVPLLSKRSYVAHSHGGQGVLSLSPNLTPPRLPWIHNSKSVGIPFSLELLLIASAMSCSHE